MLKVTAALLVLVAVVVALSGLYIWQVRRGDRGCFDWGHAAGEYAGDNVTLLLLSRVCGHDPFQQEEFFDGAGHSFAFDMSRPEHEVRRAKDAMARGPRVQFLRGMLIQFGRQNALRPGACTRFARRISTLSPRQQAFGIANGMAWGLRGRLREGRRVGLRLSGKTRSIFFEELGFQQAWHLTHSGQPVRMESLEALHPAADLCFGVHGFVRHQLIHDSARSSARALIKQAPARCRVEALHAAVRVEHLRTRADGIPPSLASLVTPPVLKKLRALNHLP